MKNRYLIRLDDACPTMAYSKWQKIEKLLDEVGICPLVGIIPANQDLMQRIDMPDENFWNMVKCWELKGWSIALHGYNHVCNSSKGLEGINPMWERSEFCGLSLLEQRMKIRAGLAIMVKNGIKPKFFFAPSHTFDETTLDALLIESDIRMISDTIATKPYKNGEFTFIPQLGGSCRRILIPGTWTFCFHPSAMTEVEFLKLEFFLKKNRSQFISFTDLDVSNLTTKNFLSKSLSLCYFLYRKLRGVK